MSENNDKQYLIGDKSFKEAASREEKELLQKIGSPYAREYTGVVAPAISHEVDKDGRPLWTHTD